MSDHWVATLVLIFFTIFPGIGQSQPERIDETAEKMLLYQRDNGGWPQYKGDATDYRKPIDEALNSKLIADKARKDATIDDRSTTFEINYLLEAFEKTKNEAYRKGAERGIAYLLEAQNAAGGWPQFYPDSSNYRKYITFNDNAMIHVMWIMKKLVEAEGPFQYVADSLKSDAVGALQNGIQCILDTQVLQNGHRTAWCAQYDDKSLKPAQARAFEPPSLSGGESVGIVRFLMSIESPSEEIKAAIRSAVRWFEAVKIEGVNIRVIEAPELSGGKDRVIYQDPGSVLWARFYDLETNQPIFMDRSGIRKSSLAEVEHERRMKYGYYGKWPKKLLEKEYPAWEKRERE